MSVYIYEQVWTNDRAGAPMEMEQNQELLGCIFRFFKVPTVYDP